VVFDSLFVCEISEDAGELFASDVDDLGIRLAHLIYSRQSDLRQIMPARSPDFDGQRTAVTYQETPIGFYLGLLQLERDCARRDEYTRSASFPKKVTARFGTKIDKHSKSIIHDPSGRRHQSHQAQR
jgi:hypothetical protein